MSAVPLTTATSLSFEEGWECDTVAPLMFKIPDDVSLLSAWSTSESLPSSQQSQVFSVDEGSASTAADVSGHIDSSALHASVEFCQDSGNAALQQRADIATSTDSRVTGIVHTAVDSKPGKQSGSVLSLHADCTMSAQALWLQLSLQLARHCMLRRFPMQVLLSRLTLACGHCTFLIAALQSSQTP